MYWPKPKPSPCTKYGHLACQFSLHGSLKAMVWCSLRHDNALGLGVNSGSLHYEPTFVQLPFWYILCITYVGILYLSIFVGQTWARCFLMTFSHVLKMLLLSIYITFDTLGRYRNIIFQIIPRFYKLFFHSFHFWVLLVWNQMTLWEYCLVIVIWTSK